MRTVWNFKKWYMAGLAVLLTLIVNWPVAAGSADKWRRTPDVKIGWTAWSDAEIVSKMAVIILSRGMKYDVELTLADIAVQYRAIAEGDLDVMLMSWQPQTHEDYLRRYDGKLLDLGVIYADASLGWVIPDYIPRSEVRSIPDLKKPSVKALFGGKIQGIAATAGLMGLSEKAIASYGLDYELVTASGPAMAKRLGKAVDRKSAIIVTGWRPHWMFAKYPLRYLEDPKGIFDSKESVHVVARKGFKADHPKVAAFFQRMHLELDELEALMVMARETSYTHAVEKWIGANKDRVKYWMQGK